MNIEKFIYNRWLAIAASLFSGLVMLFTPYPHYNNVMTVLVLIWVTSLLKYELRFLTITKNLFLLIASYLLFMKRGLWQDEYLSMILLLPYLVMAMRRLNEVKTQKLELILFGLIASVGIYVNPIFIFIPIFFELMILSTKSHIGRFNNRNLIVIILSIILLSGLFLQLITYLTIDISWILFSTNRLIEGGVFGQDVIDGNPPLIWYLSYPVVFLSKATGLHTAIVFKITATTITLFILLWMSTLIKRALSDMNTNRNILLFVAAYVFLIASGTDMGQREYIALLFSLPYVAMAVGRLNGLRPTQKEAIIVGVITGIGFALKPYFLVVPLAVEFVIWSITRRFIYFLRSEIVVGIITIMIYGFTVLVFSPDYVFEIVPFVAKSYWAQNLPYLVLFPKIQASLIGLIIAAVLCKRLSTTPIPYIFTAIGFSFTASFLIQQKGFSSHQFPIHTLAIIALTALIMEGIQRSQILGWKTVRGSILLVATTLMLLLTTSFQRTQNWYYDENRVWIKENTFAWEIDQLTTLLNKYSPEDTFLSISAHPFPGFPTGLYVRPKWAGVDMVRRYIAAIMALRNFRSKGEVNSVLAELEKVERLRIMTEFKKKPVIVLANIHETMGQINTSSTLDFFLEDPRFQKIWSNYQELEPIGNTRVFKRVNE